MAIAREITDIVARLEEAVNGMPKLWDGRQSILKMKNAGSRQWRQMDRNSGGNPRRSKAMIDIPKIPDESIVAIKCVQQEITH